ERMPVPLLTIGSGFRAELNLAYHLFLPVIAELFGSQQPDERPAAVIGVLPMIYLKLYASKRRRGHALARADQSEKQFFETRIVPYHQSARNRIGDSADQRQKLRRRSSVDPLVELWIDAEPGGFNDCFGGSFGAHSRRADYNFRQRA